MRRLLFPILLVSVFLGGLVLPALGRGAIPGELFPVHPAMQPNVEFWKKIYSHYPSTQGVLHDIDNLNIIYEVVDLVPHGHGSIQINRERVKEARERYRAILARLAAGKVAVSRDELRVHALFGPDPTPQDFQKARDNIRSQTGQKDRFLEGVQRSGKYLERIKDILRSHGLPEDLAYLPHVESSYNYDAYSKFGAAGIWQFTRSTGQRYMKVDYVVDERRDPIAASYAAAQFLKENYNLLGCWPMALTAYNHGPNGMLRAKNELGSYERIFERYNGSRFKFASRNFYAEFIAARYVAKNYRRYFGDIKLDRPVVYHTVELPGYAPLASICNFFHVGVDDIKRVNPALRPPVFDGQKHIPKGYRLRLPGPAPKMARLSSALPSSLFESTQKRSRFYRVQSGDTAGKIAIRHKVSLSDLVAANSLSRQSTIYVGQNLRIPDPEEKQGLMLASASSGRSQAAPSMTFLKNKVLAKASIEADSPSQMATLAKWQPLANPRGLVAAPEEDTLPSLVARSEKRSVQSGAPLVVAQAETQVLDLPLEPLTSDAKITEPAFPFPTPVSEVVAAGGQMDEKWGGDLEEEFPVVAESAALADLDEVAGAEAEEVAEVVNPLVLVGNFDVAKVKTVRGMLTGTIQVEVEETLGHYADWLAVPTQKIRELNSYRYGRPIHYGQNLMLPFTRVSKDDFEERRYLYHKEMVEDFFVAYRVEGERNYRIKKGDNLWTLCHVEFELPFWLIKQYNADFNFQNLRLGAEIKVPVVSRIDPDYQVADLGPAAPDEVPLARNILSPELISQ